MSADVMSQTPSSAANLETIPEDGPVRLDIQSKVDSTGTQSLEDLAVCWATILLSVELVDSRRSEPIKPVSTGTFSQAVGTSLYLQLSLSLLCV